jgi:hypothetical protein
MNIGKLKRAYGGIVDVVGVILALVVVGLWLFRDNQEIPRTLFTLLALLPGAIAVIYYFGSTLPRYLTHQEGVTDYFHFCESYDRWWQETGWTRKLASLGLKRQIDRIPAFKSLPSTAPTVDRPYFAATLWATLCLTFVFMIAVSVARDPSKLSGSFPELVGQTVTMSPSSTRTDQMPSTTTDTDTKKTASLEAAANDFFVIQTKATNGFLFAALGAFVSVMWRMIKRINSNALTARFLFTAALRSAIAMMIGLAAGQFDLFGFLNPNGPRETVLFLTGLFTDWALDALRDRARTVFDPKAGQTADQLPLDMVDGLDDGVIDILDEIGIWDIEHLATCEPGELTLRTLYPFNRVVDWIDQAVLINYLRRNIPAARDLGIRGAIDLMLLYSHIVESNKPGTMTGSSSPAERDTKGGAPPEPSQPPPPAAATVLQVPTVADTPPEMGQADAARASQQLAAPAPTDISYAARAWRTLDELATRSKISRDALEMICVNLWLDYTVEQLYRFRQHSAQREPDGKATAVA